MPIDPGIILNLQRQPPMRSPLESMSSGLGLVRQMQDIRAADDERVAQQQALQTKQLLSQAFASSRSADGTLDRKKFLSQLPGDIGFTFEKEFADLDQKVQQVQTSKLKSADEHQAAQVDLLGSLGAKIKAAGYDPTVFEIAKNEAARAGIDVSGVDQLLQRGVSIQQIADTLIQGSAEQQGLITARMNADTARMNATKPTSAAAARPVLVKKDGKWVYVKPEESYGAEGPTPSTEQSDKAPLIWKQLPDGTQVRVPDVEGVTSSTPARQRPVTGADRATLAFYNNMFEAAENMDAVEGQLTNQDIALIKNLTVPELIGNSKLTKAGQLYAQALQIFTENRLRKKSGAAIANTEYENDKKAFAKSVGDDPSTLAQKKASRQRELDGMAFSSGPAYEEYYGQAYEKPGDFVLMEGPDGTQARVAKKDVEEAKKRGAKVVGKGGH